MSKNTMTRVEYLDLRSQGWTRTRIYKEHFTNTKAFYSQLEAWGIRDKEIEEEVLLRYKAGTNQDLNEQLKQKDEEIERLRGTVKEIANEANQSGARVEELENLVAEYKNKIAVAEAYAEGVPSESGFTLERYQRDASRTANADWEQVAVRIIRGDNKLKLLNFALGATGETGEIADEIKKVVFHGHKFDPEVIAKEIGDALWYLSQLADTIGYSLDSVAQKNIEKLKERYPEGFSEERSQNRDVS